MYGVQLLEEQKSFSWFPPLKQKSEQICVSQHRLPTNFLKSPFLFLEQYNNCWRIPCEAMIGDIIHLPRGSCCVCSSLSHVPTSIAGDVTLNGSCLFGITYPNCTITDRDNNKNGPSIPFPLFFLWVEIGIATLKSEAEIVLKREHQCCSSTRKP